MMGGSENFFSTNLKILIIINLRANFHDCGGVGRVFNDQFVFDAEILEWEGLKQKAG